jgi:hypothetical protein
MIKTDDHQPVLLCHYVLVCVIEVQAKFGRCIDDLLHLCRNESSHHHASSDNHVREKLAKDFWPALSQKQ